MSKTIKSKVYDGRYMELVCSQSIDIEKNQSTISWTLSTKGGNVNSYSTGPTKVYINGVEVKHIDRKSYTSKVFPATKGSVSGTQIIKHNVDGTRTITIGFSTAIYTSTVSNYTDFWTLDPIPRATTILSAPDFSDMDNPTITYINPADEMVNKLEACISLNGNYDDIRYRAIDKTSTSYTFNLTEDERVLLRRATLNGSSSRYVSFHIRTTIGSTVLYHSIRKVFTVIDAAPVVSCDAYDINPQTTALTGNSNTIVKGHSNIEFEISATPQKEATITSRKFAIEGHRSVFSAMGTIDKVSSNKASYTVEDNRGHVITNNLSLGFVDYVDITCSQEVKSELSGETGSYITVSVEGNYYNGSFGKTQNALTIDVRYICEETGENGTIRISDIKAPTITNNKYSLSVQLPIEFDYSKPVNIQTYAADKLTSEYAMDYTVSLIPVFDWSKTDFNFNVPVNFSKGVSFEGESMKDTIVSQVISSAGWSYRKWKSGYAECWCRLQITASVTNAWGSLYTSGSLDSTNLSYPFEFMEVPTLSVSLMPFGSGGIIMAPGNGYGNIVETGPFEIARGTSLSSGQFLLSYHACGRWDL